MMPSESRGGWQQYNCRNELQAGPHEWKHMDSYMDFCFHCGEKLPCANPQKPFIPENTL